MSKGGSSAAGQTGDLGHDDLRSRSRVILDGPERAQARAYLKGIGFDDDALQRPIVAYVPESGQLLSEYCVEFPDLTGNGGRQRLPASDDVLAKWMALTSDEDRVIRRANMHLVGRQLDPARVRRDLWRLAEWERRRGGREQVQPSQR